MTLTELVSLVKKKTGTSFDCSISVGLVFERENGDAFALEDGQWSSASSARLHSRPQLARPDTSTPVCIAHLACSR